MATLCDANGKWKTSHMMQGPNVGGEQGICEVNGELCVTQKLGEDSRPTNGATARNVSSGP
jgi:hypothetical protein